MFIFSFSFEIAMDGLLAACAFTIDHHFSTSCESERYFIWNLKNKKIEMERECEKMQRAKTLCASNIIDILEF